jgi:hypothetical protein
MFNFFTVIKYVLLVLLIFAFAGCKSQRPTYYLPGFDFKLFSHSPASELAAAVEADDTDRISAALIAEKDSINYMEPKFGVTLLSLAVVNNKPIGSRMLLAAGADPNARSPKYGYTPFLNVCEYYDQFKFKNWGDMITLLLDHGANVNDSCMIPQRNGGIIVDTQTRRALDQPLAWGKVGILKLLLDRGAKLNVYPKRGTESVLVRSMANIDVFRYLLIEKQVPIPDYAVIRQEGGRYEKKMTLKELLVESKSGWDPKKSAVYKEVLAYLDSHPASQ